MENELISMLRFLLTHKHIAHKHNFEIGFTSQKVQDKSL